MQRRKRGIAEKLTEEELAIFDLLIMSEMTLRKTEERGLRRLRRSFLKLSKLVLDWRKHLQSRAAMRLSIEEILADRLPQSYAKENISINAIWSISISTTRILSVYSPAV